MKKIKLLFCAAMLLLSACANAAEPPGETATASETAGETVAEDPDEPMILVDIRGSEIGSDEFSSAAETLNVDDSLVEIVTENF